MRGLLLVPLAVLAFGCRTDKAQNEEASPLAAASTVWYDSAGQAGPCADPPKSCPPAKDERTFVDVCVAKGFQAKSCGCGVRCSGQTGYVQPATVALTGGTAGAKTPSSSRTCTQEDKDYVQSVAGSRVPNQLLTRCLDSHVCNGNIGWCVGDSLKASTRLRALARQGCESEVFGTICKDGFLDSLGCPEPDIKKLSKLWADFYQRDSSTKRCVRNVVCSDERTFCTADALALAKDVKASVDRDGCEYWLRTLCNLNGGKAW